VAWAPGEEFLHLTLNASIYLAVPGRMQPMTSITPDEGKPIHRKLLGSAPVEGLPGWETRLYMVEYSPGADGSGHHHPVVGVGHVLSGTILSAFADDQAVAIEEGQSFVDAAHLVHTVSRNASQTAPVRFVIAYTVKIGEPVTVTDE
jgi:quercetin dioxygenase-like cupin family protein